MYLRSEEKRKASSSLVDVIDYSMRNTDSLDKDNSLGIHGDATRARTNERTNEFSKR